MPRRGVAATSLGILLLSVASYIPVCDLSCSFKQIHSVCQSGVGNSAEIQMRESMPPDMVMGDQLQDVSQEDPARAITQTPSISGCLHETCGITATLAFAPSSFDRLRLHFGQVAGIAVAEVRQASLNVHFAEDEAPPPELRVFAPPLSKALRL
jgi:hypothetical protein